MSTKNLTRLAGVVVLFLAFAPSARAQVRPADQHDGLIVVQGTTVTLVVPRQGQTFTLSFVRQSDYDRALTLNGHRVLCFGHSIGTNLYMVNGYVVRN